MEEERYTLYIINDISERKSDAKLIEELAAQTAGIAACVIDGYRLIGESEIRRKVYSFLRKQEKYDLILTGDMGGTMMFPAWELKRFGKDVQRIPYSTHNLAGNPYEIVAYEAASLGGKPRILILESDLGPGGNTREKLQRVVNEICKANRNAIVHLVIGVCNKGQMAEWGGQKALMHAAFPVCHEGVRLSEILEKYSKRRSESMPDETRRMLAKARKLLEHNRRAKIEPH